MVPGAVLVEDNAVAIGDGPVINHDVPGDDEPHPAARPRAVQVENTLAGQHVFGAQLFLHGGLGQPVR